MDRFDKSVVWAISIYTKSVRKIPGIIKADVRRRIIFGKRKKNYKYRDMEYKAILQRWYIRANWTSCYRHWRTVPVCRMCASLSLIWSPTFAKAWKHRVKRQWESTVKIYVSNRTFRPVDASSLQRRYDGEQGIDVFEFVQLFRHFDEMSEYFGPLFRWRAFQYFFHGPKAYLKYEITF